MGWRRSVTNPRLTHPARGGEVQHVPGRPRPDRDDDAAGDGMGKHPTDRVAEGEAHRGDGNHLGAQRDPPSVLEVGDEPSEPSVVDQPGMDPIGGAGQEEGAEEQRSGSGDERQERADDPDAEERDTEDEVDRAEPPPCGGRGRHGERVSGGFPTQRRELDEQMADGRTSPSFLLFAFCNPPAPDMPSFYAVACSPWTSISSTAPMNCSGRISGRRREPLSMARRSARCTGSWRARSPSSPPGGPPPPPPP